MKTVKKCLSLALLAACGGSAYAESGLPPSDQRFEISGQTTAVAAALSVLKQADLDAVFTMSSGRTLTVLSAGDAISVRYGQLPEATLRHDGKGNFVSQNRKVALQFQADDKGQPQQVRVLLPTAWR